IAPSHSNNPGDPPLPPSRVYVVLPRRERNDAVRSPRVRSRSGSPPPPPPPVRDGDDGVVGAVERRARKVVHGGIDDEELFLLPLPRPLLGRLGVEHSGKQNSCVPYEHPPRLEDDRDGEAPER